MDKLQEVEAKHARLRALLAQRNAAALYLRRSRNIAWVSAGADSSIVLDSDNGVYSLVITPEQR
ncbi:MAG: peptidase M24, partial [Chloroflexi bacterium]|nr:peptidase M24 [Chloroflexota bacterium]